MKIRLEDWKEAKMKKVAVITVIWWNITSDNPLARRLLTSSRIDSDHGVGAVTATLVKQSSELNALRSCIAIVSCSYCWKEKLQKRTLRSLEELLGEREQRQRRRLECI